MKTENSAKPDAVEVTGTYGALLSTIEVGVGSLLHAYQVPFGGFFLSLNQGFILSHAAKKFRDQPFGRFLPANVSNVASLLKSLSPAGNRLGPMIAISMQGFLHNAGILLLGCNPAGAALGMALLSLWSYVQLASYYYLMFGKKLIDVLDFHLREIRAVFPVEAKHVAIAVAASIALKVFFGVILGIAAFRLSDARFEKYRRRLTGARAATGPDALENGYAGAARASLRDLFNPLFAATLSLMAVFFFLSGSPWQETSFHLIRPLAVGFLIFFGIRIFPARKIAPYLERTRFRGLSRATAKAFRMMGKSEEPVTAFLKRN